MRIENLTKAPAPRQRTLADVKVGEAFSRPDFGGHRFLRIFPVHLDKPDLIPVVCLDAPIIGPTWLPGEVAHLGAGAMVGGTVAAPAPAPCDVLTLEITGERREFQVLQQVLCHIGGARGHTPNGGLEALRSGLCDAGCEAFRERLTGTVVVPDTWDRFHGVLPETAERVKQNAKAVE